MRRLSTFPIVRGTGLGRILPIAVGVPAEYSFGMRTIGMLILGVAMAGGSLAQDSPPGRFTGPLVPSDRAPKLFRGDGGLFPKNLALPQFAPVRKSLAESRCAIPLIEMQAPKGVDLGIIKVAPNIGTHPDSVDAMPHAKLPPVCEVSPAR
jgi:hypothetical protein